MSNQRPPNQMDCALNVTEDVLKYMDEVTDDDAKNYRKGR